jgi:hypothetical protein
MSEGKPAPMNEAKPRPARISPKAAAAAGWRERDILDWLRELTIEKDRLRRSHQGRPLAAADTARLREIESTLDQVWDLVRQRRARRSTGRDWDDLTQRVAELARSHGR